MKWKIVALLWFWFESVYLVIIIVIIALTTTWLLRRQKCQHDTVTCHWCHHLATAPLFGERERARLAQEQFNTHTEVNSAFYNRQKMYSQLYEWITLINNNNNNNESVNGVAFKRISLLLIECVLDVEQMGSVAKRLHPFIIINSFISLKCLESEIGRDGRNFRYTTIARAYIQFSPLENCVDTS